ncbi:MAG TPA: 2-isopropylmalate synthase, partial [Clostridium sp.]|nr:2-isopropylmalate synthase [Clostridium sp.]
GFKLPKGMHKEFADVIQAISEKQGEVAPEQILDEFKSNYTEKKEPIHFRKAQITEAEDDTPFSTAARVRYTDHGVEKIFEGVGNGPIDAVQKGIEKELGIEI